MNTRIKHIAIYILILSLGILIGWWLNEMYRFAEGMRNDIVLPYDTVIYKIEEQKQVETIKDSNSIHDDAKIATAKALPQNDSKLDLDELFNDPENPYLLSLTDNEIQMCYGWQFDINVHDYSPFKKLIEEYKNEDGVHKVDVYVLGDSYVKTYFNNNPAINSLDLVYGRIMSDKIKLNHGIRIGMDKNEMLSKIFKYSDKFDSVDKLTIYEDERGESWSILIFQNNKLIEIIFDSAYDWIDKELKKEHTANKMYKT